MLQGRFCKLQSRSLLRAIGLRDASDGMNGPCSWMEAIGHVAFSSAKTAGSGSLHPVHPNPDCRTCLGHLPCADVRAPACNHPDARAPFGIRTLAGSLPVIIVRHAAAGILIATKSWILI